MESPDSSIVSRKTCYAEEMLLEAYNLEWEAIELRRQRLKKSWQQLLLMEQMENEELQYNRCLRKLKRQEQERRARQQIEREHDEARRREREKEVMICLKREQEKAERLKNEMMIAVGKSQTDMPSRKKKTKATDPSDMKTEVESEMAQTTKTAQIKRITPISMQHKDDDLDSVQKQNNRNGNESPPPELPDNGLLDLLSLNKASDSEEDDDSPSMVNLILPVQHESPKRAQLSPKKKKKVTPQKRLARRPGEPSLDFDFTNVEERQQMKAIESGAQDSDEERAEAESEPEPQSAVPVPPSKKHLRRRKEYKVNVSVDKVSKPANALALTAKSKLVKANSTIAGADKNAAGKNVKRIISRELPAQTTNLAKGDGDLTTRLSKKVNEKGETMSIKQRLANAELLSRISKMQEITTPKVLGRKSNKIQKQEVPKTAADKREDFRKVVKNPAERNINQRDQMVEDGDLNISLNSSGLISDADVPENLRDSSRKRMRGAVEDDMTPTKKLQFQEITKRLVKSPMPRYLRTPTPLLSPMASSHMKPKAASPGPRLANARDPINTRRLNSAPVQSRKATDANRFGIPGGGAKTAANGNSFSMFDAFVNSGSNGFIPKLKMKNRDVSPSV
ncbi:uncharacterized protein PHALS_07273 [Plasmopara halstedii]|uniref:Uncharacterized protein n=1 Tax=Plasmopara halstedii TaxID=4781 RepID=A0A0P1B594_PLAHL|nr:uncharacterized protein PHALS_07273 [Plasmopara halstedii]CEG49513.1 hypothetical protein PHALS_07273 [Plasmopara halstedii]|eukprot:XP_024585882.1 hypothetical protein PHALS_07273 [Plasmopara halstedii]